MKKITILQAVIITTFFVTTHTYDQVVHHHKKIDHKHIPFTPEDSFGGFQAIGSYNEKEKTVTIMNNNIIYSFNNIIESINPSLPEKYNNIPNIVYLGSFTNRSTRANMPILTHLFGVISDEKTNADNHMLHAVTSEAYNKISHTKFGEDQITWAPKTFTPSAEFSGDGLIGNYFVHSKTATIHDPKRNNTQTYTFENVQQSQSADVEHIPLIGSYTDNDSIIYLYSDDMIQDEKTHE